MEGSEKLKDGPWWLTTLVIFVADVLWGVAGGWKVQLNGLMFHLLIVAFMVSILLIRRFREEPRVNYTIRLMTLLILFSNASAVLSYLIVSTNAPLIDNTLSSWDMTIGFDWRSVFSWMQTHLFLRHLLQYAYASLLPQLIALVLFLGFTGRFAKLVTFIELLAVSGLTTVLLSGLFPAAGAWKFYAIGSQVNMRMISHFEPLRDGTLRTINLFNMQGLISIPSFHTVVAILIAFSMWRTPVAYLFLILDMATIVSTPIEGGHYLVDVLAGALLAVAAILVTVSRARTAQFPAVVALKQG
jgi:hypothetical protein